MADLNGEKIYQKLDAIEAKVDQLLLWKAEHTKEHEMLQRDVADNRAVLFENPGVVSKINTLSDIVNRQRTFSKFWADILKYAIIAFIVSIATWLLMLYKQN